MKSEVDMWLAAFRAAKLSSDDAVELALWLTSPDETLDEQGWSHSKVADRHGFKRDDLKPAERYTISAAALLLAVENVSLTPFQQWFQRNHTEQERMRFTKRDVQMMEIGFTQYGRR